mgnify:CR=1 FL=1
MPSCGADIHGGTNRIRFFDFNRAGKPKDAPLSENERREYLDRLEEAGLQPVPPADKITLLRRLYLDLIGLPPATTSRWPSWMAA